MEKAYSGAAYCPLRCMAVQDWDRYIRFVLLHNGIIVSDDIRY